jgi:alpha-1,3-glucan synthase
MEVDLSIESSRGALRVKAQAWAGLDVDPTAELFVFIGRWSKQKGVDLIADVFPGVLDRHPRVQLICIGPSIDLYGKFTALKLEEIMKKYPGRVYSKARYTAVPPFVFTGAEFALIPSRDEPFGLVAVEFGRKGALGIGARVGGLGSLPGWWYTVESTAIEHLHQQLKNSIEDALASKTDARAMMRAQSAKQRFPVAKWTEDLSKIHHNVIKISCANVQTRLQIRSCLRWRFHPASLSMNSVGNSSRSPSQTRSSSSTLTTQSRNRNRSNTADATSYESPNHRGRLSSRVRATSLLQEHSQSPPERASFPILTFDGATGDKQDFSLQKSDPTFKDANEKYYRAFQDVLHRLDSKSSEADLCVEKFLVKSEMKWIEKMRSARLNRSKSPSPESSIFTERRGSSLGSFMFGCPSTTGSFPSISNEHTSESSTVANEPEEFLWDNDNGSESFLNRWMLKKVAGWPIYSLLLVLGQIIAANSYQITLLTGNLADSGDAKEVYILGSIHAATSCMWWLMFRSFKSVYALSLPFFFYGMAFLLVGISASSSFVPWDLMIKLAICIYVTASSSGSLFSALNFGDEGKSWVPESHDHVNVSFRRDSC